MKRFIKATRSWALVFLALAIFPLASVGQAPPKPPPPPPPPPPSPNQTLQLNFATPVSTAPTETPGKWYPDRFPPSVFSSPATAPDGTKNTLQEGIASGDWQTPTPSFYNTQGRKYDLVANTYSMTISLYVPSSWATTNERMAGFWATAFDSSNAVGDFPIIEFQSAITSDDSGPSYPGPNSGPGFYGWDNTSGTWDFIGLPAGFKYNTWVNLTITLIPGHNFQYTVTDPAGKHGVSMTSPFSDAADASLGNVILEGYNYNKTYSIFWNNFNFSFTSLMCVK